VHEPARDERHRLDVHSLKRAATLGLVALSACRSAPEASAREAGRPTVEATDAAPTLGQRLDTFVSGFGATWGDGHAAHGLVAVARDGGVVFVHAYGMFADLDTRFAIGSITKTITAAAVLRLVDAKKIALADPLAKLVPDLGAPWAGRVTIEQLLSHTSGIPSYTDDEDLMQARGTPRAPLEVARRIANKPLTSAPGARFSYSSSNYYLLGLVLERATGKTYEAALEDLVLAPAGMTSTTMTAPADATDAAGRTLGDDDRLRPTMRPHWGLTYAASGLRSTARDLFAFDRALAGGALLSEAAGAQARTPRRGGYACGWECWREAGHALTSHEGAVDGFSAFFGRAEEARVAVVVLLATDAFAGDRVDAGAIGEPVLVMAVSDRVVPPPIETPEAPFDETRARDAAGDWTLARVRSGATQPQRASEVPSPPALRVVLENGRLFLAPTAEPRMRLFFAADGGLFPKQAGVRVKVDGNDLELVRFGRVMVYRRATR
jgi:CubicO group peptidase (beta-lactamase class C family)